MSGPIKGTKRKDAQSQTIACLAEYGPLNMYQITKQRSLWYASVHKAVNKLRSERDIQPVKDHLSMKNIKTIEYGLTFKGFLSYLANLTIDFSSFFLSDAVIEWADEEKLPKEYIDQLNQWLKRIGLETIVVEANSTKVDLLRVYNELRNALFSGLVKVIESNGVRLNYPIFTNVRWLAEKHTPVIWEILETARIVSVHPPFTLDAVTLIEHTEAAIESLESEKEKLNDPILRKAFPEEQPDNPFKLNDEKLGYAKLNLRNLLQLEDELWRRDFARYFASRSQNLVGKADMLNETLAVFFKQVAEKCRLEVEPAEKMAKLFSGLNVH